MPTINLRPSSPPSYSIQINESQRRALILAISIANTSDNQTYHSMIDSTFPTHPLQYWIDMLNDLPKVEAETPNILHGFCL